MQVDLLDWRIREELLQAIFIIYCSRGFVQTPSISLVSNAHPHHAAARSVSTVSNLAAEGWRWDDLPVQSLRFLRYYQFLPFLFYACVSRASSSNLWH
jgi:hypothetical protein